MYTVVSSFLAKRVSLTKIANLLCSHGKPSESTGQKEELFGFQNKLSEELSNYKKLITLGPRKPARWQLNWAHVHRIVSSFLAKRVSLTK